MEQVIFSCPNTLFVLPRRPDPSPDAPSVLPATVTDNSDPHQSPFWIKAVGPCWWGMDTRPLVRRNPRKSSVPHQGPSGPRRRGRPGRGPPRVRRRRPAAPGRGFTDRWLDAAWAPSNPWLARWQGRLGHGQSSMAHGRRWRRPTQVLRARWPTPWRGRCHHQLFIPYFGWGAVLTEGSTSVFPFARRPVPGAISKCSLPKAAGRPRVGDLPSSAQVRSFQ
jgi:hypothetical protein